MARIGIALMLAVLAACGGQAAITSSTSARVRSTDAAATIPTGTTGPESGTAPVPSSVESDPSRVSTSALCSGAEVDATGTVANVALNEASGLVASRTNPGVLWSHNDGGERPGVFALGLDGADLGVHPL